MRLPWIIFAVTLVGGVLLALLALILALSRYKKSATGELVLVGAAAVVETTLEPEGAVLVRGELWRARSRSGATVQRGGRVRIVGASGHLLEVEPTG